MRYAECDRVAERAIARAKQRRDLAFGMESGLCNDVAFEFRRVIADLLA